MKLSSDHIEVNTIKEMIELIYERRWTDGLPVIPPLEPLVREMLDAIGRDPQEVIGILPPKQGIATIEKIAINSVMAGCKPEYVPVVLAALEAMTEPTFNFNGIQTTTHSAVPLTIVSGPIVKELGFHYGDCTFGLIDRANGSIARAIRLIRWNIGGSRAGEMDRTTIGHPGEAAYLIAEHPDANPWEPIHVEGGFQRDDSCVSVFGCEGPHHCVAGPGTAEQALNNIASVMTTMGSNNMHFGGQTLVMLGPRAALTLSGAGFDRQKIREYLFGKARVPVRVLKTGTQRLEKIYEEELWPLYPGADRDDTLVPVVRKKENINIVVSGGWGAGSAFCAVCPGWGYLGGYMQTKKIKR